MTSSPTLLVGMHRSGTSVVARALEELGLFLGARKDANNEAWFFLELNEWLLSQAGAAWDAPSGIDFVLNDPEVRQVALATLRHLLGTPRLSVFLGRARYVRYRGLGALDFPWGFKDPRTTCTLPLWLDVFPEARVIEVVRNGVDVAASLEARTTRQLSESARWLESTTWSTRLAKRRYRRLADSVRFRGLAEGFALWEAYCRRGAAGRDLVPADRWRRVRYEDFVAEPVRHLADLAPFAGLDPPGDAVEAAASAVDPSRANAYTHDDRLRAFHETVRDSKTLQALGYPGD